MRRPNARHRRKADHGRASVTLIAVVLVVLLSAKVLNYVAPEAIRLDALQRDAASVVSAVEGWYRNTPLFHTCGDGTTKTTVPGGYVCTSGPDNSVYTHVFTTAPIDGGARKAIYPSVTAPDKQAADAMLTWSVVVPRFAPYQGNASTDWANLDPYSGQYWHFYYYSMRPTIALVDAYVATGNQTYLDRLWSVDDRFINESGTSTRMWSDEHSVAFRAMALTYQWWTLREYHALTVERSTQLLGEISKEADFLADPNHYQPEMNHGTNETAALLLVAEDFPQLPHAAAWSALAHTRFAEGLDQLIDADGVLIENSPYYHMYELDKLWQICKYTTALNIQISNDFEAKIKSMLHYATYMLQPDGSVPLLGSSLAETVHDSRTFADMAELDPEFQYVLSHGAKGTVPAQTSINFPSAGQTIMRSGWGRGAAFTNASYLSFNVGAYRTLHSQLDSLGVTFYDNGTTLLPPGGLYTYTPGTMHDYFQGTSSHNTVLVDGVSQTQGTASAGPLTTTGGITYQSASTPVYDGVSDLRTVVMADKNHIVVIDRLSSPTSHRYQQMWHLFPGAVVSQDGLSVTGKGTTINQQVTISQLQPDATTLSLVKGQASPPAGLCSQQYEVAVPCQQLAYLQTGPTASYTTLISAGAPDPSFAASYDQATATLNVHSSQGTTRLTLGSSTGHTISVDSHPAEVTAAASPITGADLGRWTGSKPGAVSVAPAVDDAQQPALVLTADQAKTRATNLTTAVDLSASSLQIRMKLVNEARIAGASLGVSSDHGRTYTRIALQEVYERRWTGGWLTMSLGRDQGLAGKGGHWTPDAAPVDWAHVNALQLTLTPRPGPGPVPAVATEWVRHTTQQASGVASIVFDDGFASILPTADYLHAHAMSANVAVIGKYTELPWRGYLTVYQLHDLQDRYGWNMVNHSQRHVDAIAAYDSRGNLGAYEQDVVDGATWLQRSGLNSAPDWFIYPHGTTDPAVEAIVGRFYTFARITGPGPESYPFGSPLRVKTLEIHSPADSSESGSSSTLTPVSEVVAAISDAKTYHTTLILTLHRIQSSPSDRPGYPLADFEKIVDALAASGLPVKTLSQLDAMNGVPETDHVTATPAVPALITLAVTSTPAPAAHHGFWGWFWNVV